MSLLQDQSSTDAGSKGSYDASASIVLRDIHKAFGGHKVLGGLNLDIHAGEFLALLGPSGCGKTTVLRIIAGFEAADAGTIAIADRDVTAMPASQRGIGFVFQSYSLFPHMTALENVAYGLKVRRQTAQSRRARATELLDMVGLKDHANHYPRELSGGQQQRVALARALAVKPRVLLLDEPLSALDAKVRVQLQEELRRLHRQTGTTMVMVTHDQEEALTVAERIAVMHDGAFEQIGKGTDVYAHPETPFVARFVGATNALPGQSSGDGQVSVLGVRLQTWGYGHSYAGKVTVYVRPEDVKLDLTADPNAHLTSLVPRGPMTSVEATLTSGQPIRADILTRDAHDWTLGASVHVWIDTHTSVLSGPPITGQAQGGEPGEMLGSDMKQPAIRAGRRKE